MEGIQQCIISIQNLSEIRRFGEKLYDDKGKYTTHLLFYIKS